MAVRGIRNKNPGCLRCKGTAGKDSGGFGIYNTWEEGYYALNSVLYRVYNGKSLRQIFKAYAPAFEKGNNPKAYSLQVARTLKEAGFNITPDTPLDLSNPEIRAAVVCGIARVECGKIPQGKDFAVAQSRAYNPATDPRSKGKSVSKKTPLKTKKPVTAKGKTAENKVSDGVHVVAKKRSKHERQAATQSETSRVFETSFADKPYQVNKLVTPMKGPYVLPGQKENEDIQALSKAALLEEYKDKTPPKKLSWLERVLPPSLGGASERERLLDEIFYPKNKSNVLEPEREMFVGVTVKDLKEAGFDDGQIVNMQARIDVKQEMENSGGLTARLAEAGTKVHMNQNELGVTNEQMSVIVALSRENTGNG